MTEYLELTGTEKVLEIGTGSGYQAAVLAALVPRVFTVERMEKLLKQARRRFHKLKLNHIYTRYADGHLGWPSQAPFDGIVVLKDAEVGEVVSPNSQGGSNARGSIDGSCWRLRGLNGLTAGSA